jgi:hypothetical protein
MSDQLMRVCPAALLFALGYSVLSPAAMLSPVATGGHDADIIFENDGSPAQNEEIGSRWYFEHGLLSGTPPAVGLPASGTVSGPSLPSGDTVDFKFESYGTNNVLDFDGAATVGSKTLTLDAPARYSKLAFVHAGGSIPASTTVPVSYTIHFIGGSTQSGSFNTFDWSTSANLAANNAVRLLVVDRANQSAGVPTLDTTRANATRWSIYATELATNTQRRIVSVDFTVTLPDAGSGDDLDVFGLSGIIVPEPSITALCVSLLVASASRLRRRRMTTIEKERW